jgi:hypothetical protein
MGLMAVLARSLRSLRHQKHHFAFLVGIPTTAIIRLQRRAPEIPTLCNFKTSKNYENARELRYPCLFLL